MGVWLVLRDSIMQKNRLLLRRLAVLFGIISLVLWSIKVVVHYNLACDGRKYSELLNIGKWAELNNKEQNVTRWFANQVKLHHQSSLLQSTCIATNASSLVARRSKLPKWSDGSFLQLRHQDHASYFVTLAAIGDLHLKLGRDERLQRNISQLLESVSQFVSQSDAVITNLENSLDRSEESMKDLSSIRSLGVQVVSLANDPISLLAGKGGTIRETTHVLEAADIRWLGLNAKQHQIVVVGGQRIGFLAFCGVHGQCIHPSNMPFAPLKYSARVANSAVHELREHGVKVIVVIMYWGREGSYFPDETVLTIARRLAHLDVTAVIGYHPNAVQDHAYFGNTLVLFSLGNVLSSDITTPYCWQQVSGEWRYSSSADHCKIVPPRAREGLRHNEQQTRVYRIHISKSEPVIGEYVTLPLEYTEHYGTRIKRPVITHNDTLQWKMVCGELDTHCLACDQL